MLYRPQAIYRAVHAEALLLAGAKSFLYEVKVDVMTVPSPSEHISTT